MTFLYETNILNQPLEWRRILDNQLPSRLSALDFKKIYFIGIGSSFWVAKIAEFLWREYVEMNAIAVQSYDFVNSRYIVSPDDIVVIFSHRGTKTFSIRALEVVKEHFGATTVLVTGMESPISINTDIRIETCPQENCGAFTISLTSAIVRILQWIDMYSGGLIERFKIWLESFRLPFNIHKLPKFSDKLILVGDLIREAIAHEVALKISETSYLPVRSYGIEQFLHGPRVTLDKESSVVAFTSKSQNRQDTLIKYVNAIGAELIEINDEKQQSFASLSHEFNWFAQLVWGQQLALELAKQLGTNPDKVRKDQCIYANAGNEISL
ncbi:MAG: SIS domain-containing protein [Nitrososphaeraceae archaeon]|nr:SIS domain-containing protein [Nitrososphaeraceae archaeon]